ncbi:hypothetical protein [Pseudoduganella lutea]|uniref:Uncharacterized protein n=1 Tax=Pseudoduganella lutea TaxID=321985 RepID=A0A4P6KU71_9BURK|nr:hypothetical protein [Pseudoduganella lutea]QBE62356.1 hypothetical protein EWM63_04635 [Pseudoduganella lutea]
MKHGEAGWSGLSVARHRNILQQSDLADEGTLPCASVGFFTIPQAQCFRIAAEIIVRAKLIADALAPVQQGCAAANRKCQIKTNIS